MSPRARCRQGGAALLAAMLTVTLVATFAATALWQQWRSVEVEAAERTRIQSAWILIGALDWSRLILIEDSRAGGADHLAEPWAVPLEEARLSTFLAADRNVTQIDDAGGGEEAFLSGQIIDLQSRLNLANLVSGDTVNEAALAQFERLFAQLGLPPAELTALVQALRQAQAPGSENTDAPLMPQSPSQLAWLGLAPRTLALLAPHITLLPERKPVNLNTAGAEVLMATLRGLDRAGADRIMAVRQMQPFRSVDDVKKLLGEQIEVSGSEHGVASSYFEVHGRLRMGPTVVQERSLVRRMGLEATTVWRERTGARVPGMS
ncbi:MAG TPA: type II secretion system minor pseudopilin GspK [Giesbergeria sp.]|uniref:type II secretion system minor pseudopilin GspK n=1 Tax=Acidovorax sp. 210-6 TaxID=2699468 RepID=UPI001389D57D|nr:type II secretion system minor pseudopilin GspK [Acidovorax sp. 210-6]NCU67174.1 type II secretion system minor pseudopilin GspK [Acidovorax sp. 210-6]HNQ10423.1 type II secretion system minor pseudopilin GspK [Giesbergeria sp.]